MGRPLVSVLLPVYNAAPFLAQCLDSVREQQLQDWELIAVDDGSIDNSYRILQDYSQRDPRIRVFSLPQGSPGGEGYPCNRALEKAQGLFIARLDADDWLQPEALSLLSSALEKSNADIAVARYQLVVRDLPPQPDYGDDACWRYLHARSIAGVLTAPFDDALLHLGPVACRNLYRRDFLLQYGIGYPEGDFRSQDHGLHWLCWSQASKAVLVDAVLYNYRRGVSGQLTGARIEQLIESYSQVMDWVVEQLSKRGLFEYYYLPFILDNLRQVVGLARQLPYAEARCPLRLLSQRMWALHPLRPLRSPRLRAHLKLCYWRWLRFCLQRAHPWIFLVDSPPSRLAFRLLRAAGKTD